MKITIDTKEDSAEDIKNAIQILTHAILNKPNENKPHNIFEETSASAQPVFGNIFGEVETKPKEKKERIEIIPY